MCGGGRRASTGNRWRRVEFDRRSARTRTVCREGGGGRSPLRDGLLQQADPGRPDRAFSRRFTTRRALPIILYNVPGRTVANLSVETIGVLSNLPRIIGVKDATGDLARVALQRLASGEDFIQLSGEDMTAVGFNAMGGAGCIGVTANAAPDLCARMQAASLRGDHAGAFGVAGQNSPRYMRQFLRRQVPPR